MTRHLVPSLRLLVEQQAPWTIVRVSGELGWESHAMLDDCLSELVLEAERPCVCIDLTALEFCDSSGIACMVRAWRTATRKGGLLIVVRPSGYLARKLRRMGLDDVLPVVSEPPGSSGPALSSGSLHEHGIDPAAVFIADPGQPSRLGEAARAMQCHRSWIPGVGDDRDHLQRTSRRTCREQRV
jgi:anti-sigma B factor antagonist